MGDEKVQEFSIRTDLAVEAKESFEKDNVEIKGVTIEEEFDEKSQIKITRVVIVTDEGANAMKKPKGNYITLEAANMDETDEDYHREISVELAKQLKNLIFEQINMKNKEEQGFLIVGLGNREVTPDALGPQVVDNAFITRHIIKEYGKESFGTEKVNKISGIAPGVMAQTGMETLEILRGIVKETKPDMVIVVDALAARNTKRLNRTIQVTDTGIHPGSGVGNNRKGLTKESLLVPVIAIGVPTVVDAATIVNDTMENLIEIMMNAKELSSIGETLKTFQPGEKYQLIKELLAPNLNQMFVTPKDIDETIQRISFTISEALNMALNIGEVDMV